MVDTAKRYWKSGQRWFKRTCRKQPWFNNIVTAVGRFVEVKASRLAAALTYKSFLAVFPVLLLAFSVLGFVMQGNPEATKEVTKYLEENIPTLKADSIAGARLTTGIIGVIGVLFTGLSWIEEFRAAVRAVWLKEEDPGPFLRNKAVDVVVMLTLGGVLLASMVATFIATSGASWLLDLLPFSTGVVLNVLGIAAGIAVNMVLFYLLLTFVPRLRMTIGRVGWAVLLGGLGLEVLKQFTQLFVGYAVDNPAYAVVATAVGLLLFFNFFNQLLLFCAALTATSKRGAVRERTMPTVKPL